jgi:hypothetical protein
MDFDPGKAGSSCARSFYAALCRRTRTKCAARLGVSAQPLAATAGCVAA